MGSIALLQGCSKLRLVPSFRGCVPTGTPPGYHHLQGGGGALKGVQGGVLP